MINSSTQPKLGRRVRKVNLRRELKAGYLRENETNRQLAEEWFLLDGEAWKTAEKEWISDSGRQSAHRRRI